MKKLIRMAAAVCSAVILAACGGGGGGDTAAVVAEDAAITIDPTTGPAVVAALAGETFAFPAGVPAFGTNAATSVTFQAPAAAGGNPRFTIGSGGNTASGTVAFGSCIFRVTSSTYAASSPLARGKTITIPNCGITLNTGGVAADGSENEVSAVLSLNGADSNGTTVEVQVNADGELIVNGEVVGEVEVVEGTGT